MYADGQKKACAEYGLTKLGWRHHIIGEPGTFRRVLQQAASGSLTKPGGLYRDSLSWLAPPLDFGRRNAPLRERILPTAGTLASLALGPGAMLHSAYQAVTAPPEQRGEAVGGLVGGLVGGTAGHPFGLLGNFGGSIAGDMLGSRLGRHFNRPAAPDFSQYQAGTQ